MAFADDLHLEINNGNCAPLILLDLLVAFGTVAHKMLIKHLYDLVDIYRTALN